MDQDQLALINVFYQGSAEFLNSCEESLLTLESHPNDEEALNRVLRNMHRLKGDSMLLDLVAFSKFAHVLEELLVHMRSKVIPVSSDVISFLLAGVDTLRKMSKTFVGVTLNEKAAVETTGPTPSRATPVTNNTVRVETEKLDRLVDLTGEIAINRRRLMEMLEDPQLTGKARLLETHQESDRLFMDLQEIVLQTRMVPLGPLFRQQTRTLRDMASQLGKQVSLTIEGDNVEVDTLIANSLRDPITHTLRNAIDHGIETPSVRAAAGKNPIGKILIKATREAGSVMIEIADDGGGLVREKIRAKLVAQRWVENPNKLSDQELCDFIFRPGFSTTEVVSDISGRGVGMDIVRRSIESLNGTVQVESEEGKGTRIVLRLPLTLAIIQGFGVGVGNETFVLPLETVKECVGLPDKEKINRELAGTLSLRGDALPYINLGRHFGVPGDESDRPNVVVVKSGGKYLGLRVDEIYGEGQAVVKPLPAKFQGVVGISGATITGGGRVALILDVVGLMRCVEEVKSEGLGSDLKKTPGK